MLEKVKHYDEAFVNAMERYTDEHPPLDGPMHVSADIEDVDEMIAACAGTETGTILDAVNKQVQATGGKCLARTVYISEDMTDYLIFTAIWIDHERVRTESCTVYC